MMQVSQNPETCFQRNIFSIFIKKFNEHFTQLINKTTTRVVEVVGVN